MSNMSYCRFQNTLNDLKDCYNHMDDLSLSEEELLARKEMINMCDDIVADFKDEEDQDEE